jgi:hypothetical protein
VIVAVSKQDFRPVAPEKSKAASSFEWAPKYDLEGLAADLLAGDLTVNKNPRFFE